MRPTSFPGPGSPCGTAGGTQFFPLASCWCERRESAVVLAYISVSPFSLTLTSVSLCPCSFFCLCVCLCPFVSLSLDSHHYLCLTLSLYVPLCLSLCLSVSLCYSASMSPQLSLSVSFCLCLCVPLLPLFFCLCTSLYPCLSLWFLSLSLCPVSVYLCVPVYVIPGVCLTPHHPFPQYRHGEGPRVFFGVFSPIDEEALSAPPWLGQSLTRPDLRLPDQLS